MNLSLNQTLLILCETNLKDSVDSITLSMGRGRGYVPLICNDFVAHMDGLALCVKEGFLFTWELSQENSQNSCFRLTLLHLISYFCFIY